MRVEMAGDADDVAGRAPGPTRGAHSYWVRSRSHPEATVTMSSSDAALARGGATGCASTYGAMW
jgi:hypothetical protein